MAEMIPFLLFICTCAVLLAGYPVALSLAGTALLFAAAGSYSGHFDGAYLQALPNRLFGIMGNTTLVAVPLFVMMGVMLEKSRLSEDLLESMADLLGGLRNGLGISVILVGALRVGSCSGNPRRIQSARKYRQLLASGPNHSSNSARTCSTRRPSTSAKPSTDTDSSDWPSGA